MARNKAIHEQVSHVISSIVNASTSTKDSRTQLKSSRAFQNTSTNSHTMRGLFLNGLSCPIKSHFSNVEFVEAMALLNAVRWAHIQGLVEVHFRGFSAIGHVITMIKELLVVNRFSIQFILRTSNGLAHYFASFSLHSVGTQEWYPRGSMVLRTGPDRSVRL